MHSDNGDNLQAIEPFKVDLNQVVCPRQVAVCQHGQSVHTGLQLLAAEKALLMKLRKSTGYTFTNCKKALEKFDNDMSQVRQTHSFCFGGWS